MNTGNKKGFTLVEILVVLVIFSIMLSAIAAVFISGIKIQRNAIAQEQLLDQLNYAIEYMGRELRMAKYKDNNACKTKDEYYNSNNSYLGIVNQDGECVYFNLKTDNVIYKSAKSDTYDTALTSDDIKVTKLLFKVSEENGKQTKVTILIEAESKSGDPLQKVKIQTTISARDLNKGL